MLNLNELDVFVKAAETCSFSAAARQLHMSQPAVSLLIRSLERRLRTPLFQRSGRSVALTEAGQMLVPMARDLLLRARRAEEAVTSVNGEVAGDLTLACSTTTGKYFLPHLIARFRAQHPQVTARIQVTNQKMAIEMVLEGSAHLGVTSTPVEHSQLEYQPFITDPIVLIVPTGHPWCDRGLVQPDELLSEPMLLRESTSGTRKAMLEGLAACGISMEDLNICMELGNAEAIEMAVEAGLGISFVSVMAAAKGLELGRIQVVRVEGLELSRSIAMVRSRQHAASRAQKSFCEFALSQEHQRIFRHLLELPRAISPTVNPSPRLPSSKG